MGRTFDDEPLEPEMFGPPLVLLLLLPIPLEPLPELGLRKLVLSKNERKIHLISLSNMDFQSWKEKGNILYGICRQREEIT